MKVFSSSAQVLTIAAFVFLINSAALSQRKQHQKQRPKTFSTPKQSLEVGKQINLHLKRCVTAISFPEPGSISFYGLPDLSKPSLLEIDGQKITVSNDSGSVMGEVRSYARSAYWIDANMGFIFGRTTTPSSNPNWKPPRIISFVLLQDRQLPTRFTITPAVGLNPAGMLPSRLSCASVSASQ